MDLGTQRADQAETAGRVGKDPDDPGAPLDLLVEPLEHVRALEMLVVLARQAIEVQRLPDVRFDPVGELRIALLPPREPRLEVLLGFLEIPPVVEPPQLLPTVVVRLARQVVQGIAEEVDVAALPHGFGEQFPDGALEPGMVVRDDELHAVEAAGL